MNELQTRIALGAAPLIGASVIVATALLCNRIGRPKKVNYGSTLSYEVLNDYRKYFNIP